jgi:hypothetical protein
MTMTRGKLIIGSLWGLGFLISFTLMTIQTVNGVYQDKGLDAWAWFTPNIIPTIGLIIGVLIADGARWMQQDGTEQTPINPLMVVLTAILSLAHLSILLVIILMAANKSPLSEVFTTLRSANLPLVAIQGLITLTLGVFFKKS